MAQVNQSGEKERAEEEQSHMNHVTENECRL